MKVMLFSYFLDQLYPTMIQIFFYFLDFSGESVSVVSPPSVFFVIFSFPLIASSSMIFLTISTTKILLGVPLFSLLFFVYVRIIISTKEFEVNTPQVLAILAKRPNHYECIDQAGLPVGCRTEYRTVWPTPESRLAD